MNKSNNLLLIGTIISCFTLSFVLFTDVENARLKFNEIDHKWRFMESYINAYRLYNPIYN